MSEFCPDEKPSALVRILTQPIILGKKPAVLPTGKSRLETQVGFIKAIPGMSVETQREGLAAAVGMCSNPKNTKTTFRGVTAGGYPYEEYDVRVPVFEYVGDRTLLWTAGVEPEAGWEQNRINAKMRNSKPGD